MKENKVIFTYFSPDGEEGFPGDLLTTVTYEVKENVLNVLFEAVSSTSTVINLTNHSYFNLAGHVCHFFARLGIYLSTKSYLLPFTEKN